MDHRFQHFVSKKLIIVICVMVVIGILIWQAPSSEATDAPDQPAPTTTTVIIDQPTTTDVVSNSAQPAQPAPLVLTPEQWRYIAILHVNNMTYNYGDPAPAMEAFRLVAAQRGWSAEQIASWETAAARIMKGESGYCPNVLRGARLANVQGCELSRQGTHQDAGFAQLIGIHYLPSSHPHRGWLCRQEGLCSKWDIIASPWNSMTAFVALIERSGVQPWCYSARARSYHRVACSNPGFDV